MDNHLFGKLNVGPGVISAIRLTVDGRTVEAEEGDSVASVLLRLDPPFSRTTPVGEKPRTPYCMMGVCFDCLAVVDGLASTQTCLVMVRQGMRVERQTGRRTVAFSEILP
jgi:predicted molibdopterin-dependent oxidoreductase YjgC